MPNRYELLRRMMDWQGSKRHFLNLAKDSLPTDEYLNLERFIEQGYAEKERRHYSQPSSPASDIYIEWCRHFNQSVYIAAVSRLHDIHMELAIPEALVGGLSETQINSLLKSSACIIKDGSIRITKSVPYGSAEIFIKQTLDIFNVAFIRGLPPPNPPAKSRYDRIVGTDCLEV